MTTHAPKNLRGERIFIAPSRLLDNRTAGAASASDGAGPTEEDNPCSGVIAAFFAASAGADAPTRQIGTFTPGAPCRQPMRRALATCLLLVLLPPVARAQSTVNANRHQAWAANLGWTDWRPSAAAGVVLGEYVCTGNVYAANVGWISLGNGSPVNGIQYGNAAAGDFGVNYLPSTTPSVGLLRGFAYGANVGWINFENLGNPTVNLLTGQLSGFAYSANCGWINLGTGTSYALQTDSLAPGVDTDGDGITDAYEWRYFGNLSTANATSDRDGDGVTDLQEYLEGIDPTSPNGPLRITAFARGGTTLTLTFSSTTARLYRIEQSPSLTAPAWTDAGLGTFAPDPGAATTRQFSAAATATAPSFYRVRALRFGL